MKKIIYAQLSTLPFLTTYYSIAHFHIHIITIIEMLALLAASTLAVSGAMAQLLPTEIAGLR